MTKVLDKVLPSLSLKMLKAFGKDFQYIPLIAPSVGDAAEGSASKDDGFKEGTPFTVAGVVEDYTFNRDPAYANALIEVGDKKLSIAGKSFPTEQPKAGDKVVLNTLKYTVLKVEAVYSGDDVALYILQIRHS